MVQRGGSFPRQYPRSSLSPKPTQHPGLQTVGFQSTIPPVKFTKGCGQGKQPSTQQEREMAGAAWRQTKGSRAKFPKALSQTNGEKVVAEGGPLGAKPLSGEGGGFAPDTLKTLSGHSRDTFLTLFGHFLGFGAPAPDQGSTLRVQPSKALLRSWCTRGTCLERGCCKAVNSGVSSQREQGGAAKTQFWQRFSAKF